MNGKTMLFIDQYAQPVWARTLKELRIKAGGGRVSKMYNDRKDGSVVHTGYVVGTRWFNAYTPMERAP